MIMLEGEKVPEQRMWDAAHETTASTIILMLLRIKQSPHVLDALRSEQKQVSLLT